MPNKSFEDLFVPDAKQFWDSLPPGYGWTQYVYSSGDIRWRMYKYQQHVPQLSHHQIETSNNNVDETSHISNESASTSHYKELLRQQEECFAAEKQKLSDKIKAMENREKDYKSTIDGLECFMESTNTTCNRLRKEIDQLYEQIFQLSSRKTHYKKLLRQKKEKFAAEKEKFATQMKTMQDHEQAHFKKLLSHEKEKFAAQMKTMQDREQAHFKKLLRQEKEKFATKKEKFAVQIKTKQDREHDYQSSKTISSTDSLAPIIHLHLKSTTQIDTPKLSTNDETSSVSHVSNKLTWPHIKTRFQTIIDKRAK